MPVAKLDDAELHFEDRGTGDPLLLIAGIPAIADDWSALALPLSQSRRVIAYDNRGSGRSTVTAGPYTTRGLAADAVALLDRLDIERADVFGMSMGGMIAQELALGWPTRVRRLILGCTHAGVAHAARQPREAALAFAMQTDDWSLRMRTLAPFAFARTVDPAVLQAFIEKKSADVQDPAGYAAQIAAVLTHDAADRLAQIAAPTLVVTGDDDQVIPGQSSELLVERIADSRLRVLAGAGHLFFIEQPRETLALLDAFLAESTDASA
ncbi:MAG TPA: alpha/beta fold hydrolase [Solirubrobacteraceae bacterium]|nr:alpha/beta fold hydrolase [Solirubrobacteraceae bacterium]